MSNVILDDNVPNSISGTLALIDGEMSLTSEYFLHSIWTQLQFPDPQSINWDAYLDWMRDLSWLATNKISIVITNYDSFLSKELDKKQYFASDLENIVFPFWDKDAEEVFENKEDVKEFNIYCLKHQCNHISVPTKNVISFVQRNILKGQKTPHQISQPILRAQNEKLYLAFFVFFYTAEQLRSAMIPRPSMWATVDINTGNIVSRYQCKDRDFSGATYEKLYSIVPDTSQQHSRYYLDSAYALMDIIRDEYIKTGNVRQDLYDEYLQRIYNITPKDYQKFYDDLSCIGRKG